MIEGRPFLISEKDLDWCQKNNVHVVWPGHVDYPVEFANLTMRPGVLFYMGSPLWKEYPLISIVGSRSPSTTSLTWLDQSLGELLKLCKIAVVSGGARGIDQKAHQIAIRNGRPTCIFLPSGLQHIYPQNLKEWVQHVIEGGGCIVSQFLPSMIMQKGYFRARNRLIAAISPLTLVVECKRRSGTMLTAKFALEFEKKLGVMPTTPGEFGLGGLDLICDSAATPIRDSQDILLLYGSALSYMPELYNCKN